MAREPLARSLILSVALSAVVGLFAGLAAGFAGIEWSVRPELARIQEKLAGLGSASGTIAVPPTKPPVEIVPVETRPLTPAYPAAFSDRRPSSVLRLIKRASRSSEEPVALERELASAVAVTSDGWIATADTALAGMRLTDLAIEVGGRVQPVERGVRDRSTGVAYLKIAADGLSTPTFVRSSDVVSGAAVWVESVPREFHPEIVLAARARMPTEPQSSERVGRRFLISIPNASDRLIGAAVWDGAGRLLGLVERADAGEARVIPAAPIGSSLNQFLSSGSIRRASLGIRSLDLSDVTLDVPTSSLPSLGVWLRADRRAGLPAISPRGPSAGLLLEGDVIERVERDILDGIADVGERLLEYRPGVSVSLSGRRRGSAFQVQITLGTESVNENIK